MESSTLAQARKQLTVRRHEILARYRSELLRSEAAFAGNEIELVDRAAERWDARLLDMLGTADLERLAAIYAALERIDDGRYGTCVTCRRAIEPARLRALPEASRCLACARE